MRQRRYRDAAGEIDWAAALYDGRDRLEGRAADGRKPEQFTLRQGQMLQSRTTIENQLAPHDQSLWQALEVDAAGEIEVTVDAERIAQVCHRTVAQLKRLGDVDGTTEA